MSTQFNMPFDVYASYIKNLCGSGICAYTYKYALLGHSPNNSRCNNMTEHAPPDGGSKHDIARSAAVGGHLPLLPLHLEGRRMRRRRGSGGEKEEEREEGAWEE